MAEQAAKTVQAPLWSRNFVLITLISLFSFLGFQMLMPTLPVFAKKLGGSDATAGLVIGIFAISALLARPISGYGLDRFGRKKFLFAGLLLFLVSVMAYHWALTMGMLLFFRFLHGFAWGLSSTATSTTATDIIPKSRLGEGMGYFGLAGTLSMALGPAAGLWLVSYADFDVLFTTATVMVMLAISLAFLIRFPAVPLTGKQSSFTLVEKTALPPALVIFFLTMTYGSITSFLALYASQKGIANIGPFFMVYALALFATRPTAGRLSDRIGYTVIVVPSILCIIAAMTVLSYAQSMTWFLAAAVLYGLGMGAGQPSLQALSVIATPPERRGAANSTFFTGFDLGIGLGSILWGAVSQAIGYSAMYLWTVLPAAIALIVYLMIKPKGR